MVDSHQAINMQRISFGIALAGCSVLGAIASLFAIAPARGAEIDPRLTFEVMGCEGRWGMRAVMAALALPQPLNHLLSCDDLQSGSAGRKAGKGSQGQSSGLWLQNMSEKTDSVYQKTIGQANNIVVETDHESVSFSHVLHYSCCAAIALESKVENDTIAVMEVNNGEVCRCSCQYSINASLGPLDAGTYELRVYGVRNGSTFHNWSDQSGLLFEQTIEIQPSEEKF